jgi:hypothetical protein
VLAPFGEAERADLYRVIDRATEALCCLIHQGAQAAMGVYNRAD